MIKYTLPALYGLTAMAGAIALLAVLVPTQAPQAFPKPPALPEPVQELVVDRTHKGDRLVSLHSPVVDTQNLWARFDVPQRVPAQAPQALEQAPESSPTSNPEPSPTKHHRHHDDVCSQHGLTKVYTNRWSWRCRRA